MSIKMSNPPLFFYLSSSNTFVFLSFFSSLVLLYLDGCRDDLVLFFSFLFNIFNLSFLLLILFYSFLLFGYVCCSILSSDPFSLFSSNILVFVSFSSPSSYFSFLLFLLIFFHLLSSSSLFIYLFF